MNRQSNLHFWGNALGLTLICCILTFAFADQILHHDIPCPLCLLQRISFIGIGICLILNLHLGFRSSHYGYMLLQTVIGLAISVRQLYIHLGTNSPGYGTMIWGLYFYAWAAIIFIFMIVSIAIALIFEQGLNTEQNKLHKGVFTLMVVFLLLILANGISTVVQCGLKSCPENPTFYYLLQ